MGNKYYVCTHTQINISFYTEGILASPLISSNFLSCSVPVSLFSLYFCLWQRDFFLYLQHSFYHWSSSSPSSSIPNLLFSSILLSSYSQDLGGGKLKSPKEIRAIIISCVFLRDWKKLIISFQYFCKKIRRKEKEKYFSSLEKMLLSKRTQFLDLSLSPSHFPKKASICLY